MPDSPENDKKTQQMPPGLLVIRLAGFATACMGGLALLGWVLKVPRLASLYESLIPMAPSTALLFLLFGIALSLCAVEPLPRFTRMLCSAIAALGIVVALVLFAAAAWGAQWKAELLGLSLNVSLKGIPIGHMSPVTAICFVVAGLSFLASLISPARRVWRTGAALGYAGLLLIACVVLLVAYFLELPLFYEGKTIPPAATTMLAFAALGAGLCSLAYRQMRPEGGTHESTLTSRTGIALVLTLCLLVIGIISLVILYYQTHERRFLNEVEQQLTTVANLKADDLVQWRRERMGDAAVLYKNSAFSALVRRNLDNPNDARSQKQLHVWLRQLQLQYDRVSLYDTQGTERLSVPDAPQPPASDFLRCAAEILRTRQMVFEDFYRDDHEQRVYLSVLVPILDDQAGDEVIGILALRIDPETHLYPMLQRWPTPSRTAETHLVRREGGDVVFLNDLRFQKDAPLNFRSSLNEHNQPAVEAVSGYEGIVEGKDYRGVQVLAAVRAVPDSPWFLVTRMDLAEINASLGERIRLTVLLGAVLLFGSAAVAGLIWKRHTTQTYREKLAMSEALRREESLMLTLLENLPDNIYFKDTASRFIRVNPAMVKAFGLSDPGQLIGKSDVDFFSPEVARQFMADEQEIMSTGKPRLDMEQHEIWPNGLDGWMLASKMPLRDAAGKIIGTCGISVNISAQKRAEEALQKTGLELQEKNAELERFLYTASHDLKSPVVTIKTFLGYLKQDMAAADPAQIEKDVFYIGTAVDKMARLLDELLEISRIGRVVSPPVKVTFRTLVDEALNAVAGSLSERGVKVTVSGGDDLTLYGDRTRLEEIWQNLVDNACKFMGGQKEPRLEIGVEAHDTETVFFVRDNGIGIDPRHQSKVFGLFEKLDPSAKGTGIGLALIKRIVEIYGGRIWVESAGLNQGTNFLFTLPGAAIAVQEIKK